jgi:hypothetical protein
MTALPNIAPKVHVQLLKHFQSGNLEEAWKIQRLLAHSEWACSKLSGIAGVKAVVAREFKYGSRRVSAAKVQGGQGDRDPRRTREIRGRHSVGEILVER